MRRLLTTLTMFAALTASACTNDSTSPNGAIDGYYVLRTINGSPLPDSRTGISSEALTLNPDGSYQDVAVFTNGNSFQEYGFYSQNNNAISFDDRTDNIRYEGSISGNVLTEISNGYTAVYEKQ